MGCTQSRNEYPAQWIRSRTTRYEEIARVLLEEGHRGPTSQEKRRVEEYAPHEFLPVDESKPPLLVLAKDNEEWFR